MKLSYEIKPVQKITAPEKNKMLELMTAHYDNVSEQKFHADLQHKDGVLALSDEQNNLCGFSTYQIYDAEFRGTNYSILFSGDTIVKQDCWGQLALFRSFARLMKFALNAKDQPVYWLLLSKGIRTYLFLPLYFKTFYPAINANTPEHEQALLHQIAERRFADFYKKDKGIVQIQPPADRLKDKLAIIPEAKKEDPNVRFFLEKNPGYLYGDELVCITKVDYDNFTRATRKFIDRV
jgi:hypothetical protein